VARRRELTGGRRKLHEIKLQNYAVGQVFGVEGEEEIEVAV
jgi:hypothetical protein